MISYYQWHRLPRKDKTYGIVTLKTKNILDNWCGIVLYYADGSKSTFQRDLEILYCLTFFITLGKSFIFFESRLNKSQDFQCCTGRPAARTAGLVTRQYSRALRLGPDITDCDSSKVGCIQRILGRDSRLINNRKELILKLLF